VGAGVEGVESPGDVGVEIVHEHPERRVVPSTTAGERRAARPRDAAGGGGHVGALSSVLVSV